VELCGWFLTDGTCKVSKAVEPAKRKQPGRKYVGDLVSASLMQSARANHQKVARIDALLYRLGCCAHRRLGTNHIVTWRLDRSTSELLHQLFPQRVATMDFLVQLGRQEAQVLLDAMMLGDGTVDRHGKRTFISRSKDAIDAFQVLCTMCGEVASIVWRDMSRYQPRSAKMANVPKMTGVWVANIQRRDTAQVLGRQRREFRSKQGVWCPVVPNTYFVARRRGQVYITGNTPVQGTANEFCLASLVALVDWIRKTRFPARVVLTVHDSILSSTPPQHVEELAAKKQEIMAGWNSGNVPLKVDFKVGAAWGSMERYKIGDKILSSGQGLG
jgi:hypothetical protein